MVGNAPSRMDIHEEWVAEHCPGDAPGRLRYIKRRGFFHSIAKVELPQLSEFECEGGAKANWDKCNEIMNARARLLASAPTLRYAGDEALAALYGCREVLGDIGNIGHAINLLEEALSQSQEPPVIS